MLQVGAALQRLDIKTTWQPGLGCHWRKQSPCIMSRLHHVHYPIAACQQQDDDMYNQWAEASLLKFHGSFAGGGLPQGADHDEQCS